MPLMLLPSEVPLKSAGGGSCIDFVDCGKLAMWWRGDGGNRSAWKAFCSVCIALEFGYYVYHVWDTPLLGLFGLLMIGRYLVETWGQETPTWVCPGGPVLWLFIYAMIFPGIVYLLGFCTRHQDVSFAARDALAATLFVFGNMCSLWYELSRFAWKKRPESKGKLHTLGLARYCIHPNYFGDLFTFTGWALAAGTTCALSMPLGMLASFIFLVCPNSDAYLAERYWHEFPEYAQETATLVPFVRSAAVNRALGLMALLGSIWLSVNCGGQCG